MFAAVGALDLMGEEAHLVALSAAFDPNCIPLSEAGEVQASLVNMQKLVNGMALRFMDRFAESGAWRKDGDNSPEDNIARTTGTTRGKAKAKLDTSKKLGDLPDTDDAVRKGELSDDEADAVVDGAVASPDDEQDLINTAKAKTKNLKDLRDAAARAKAKADKDRDATQRRIHKNRFARRWRDKEGGYNLHLRNTGALGAEIDAALKPVIERIFNAARRAGRHESPEAYAADAVTECLTGQPATAPTPAPPPPKPSSSAASKPTTAPAPAADWTTDGQSEFTWPDDDTNLPGPFDEPGLNLHSSAADRGDEPEATGPVTPTDPTPEPPKPAPRSGNSHRRPEYKVIAHIDYDALIRGRLEPGERCEIAGVGPVPLSTVRAMLDDAFLALIVTDGVDVYNVAHAGRKLNAHQRTALEARAYQCERPGCDCRVNLDLDHNNGDYADVLYTWVPGIGWFCGRDHKLKTTKGYDLRGPVGRRSWIGPDGLIIETDDAEQTVGQPFRGPPLRPATILRDEELDDPAC